MVVLFVVVAASVRGGAAEEGEKGVDGVEGLLASESESSEALGCVRGRFRLAAKPPCVDGFVFLVLLGSEARILMAEGLMGVGLEDAVRPAVTFLMALMPAVLLAGFEAVGARAGAGRMDGGGRAGGAAGICIVI